MHEHSLIANLLKQIESVTVASGASRVVGVTVRLGALSNISPEHFREHFVNETPGTLAEGARLEVTRGSSATDPYAQQIVLESVEVEEAG